MLSGGVGTRMNFDSFPKQYVVVAGLPVIMYSLKSLDVSGEIESIVVVAEDRWHKRILKWCSDYEIRKPVRLASAGATRQHSIRNGLAETASEPPVDDVVIIHDAARPNLTPEMISLYISASIGHDGVMPALPMKDTVYASADGLVIEKLLDRSKLYLGQAPEVFRFGTYYDINAKASGEELAATRGSSELAFKYGMDVRIVSGDESNYKLTTREDLKRFCEDKGVSYRECIMAIERSLSRAKKEARI